MSQGDIESYQGDKEEWSPEYHLKLLKGEAYEPDVHEGNALELPPWFDSERFQRGQEFFKNNFYALMTSKLCGLVAILTIPEISRILVMTQKSSNPKTAFIRYVQTIAHMLLWYQGDVKDPQSWAFKSLKEVHNKHCAASKRGKKEGVGAVSQASLAATQFGFMGYPLLVPEKLGIHGTTEEIDGFVHFWRTIGYMVGIKDKYNICRESVAETKALCEVILHQLFIPVLEEPFQDFTDLRVALLKGFWAIVPEIDVEGFTTYIRYVSGLKVGPFTNWYSKFIYNFQVFVSKSLLGSKWFGGMWRAIFNFHMWLTLVITMKFPFLAYYAHGVPLKPLGVRY